MTAPALERPRSKSGRSNFELNTWLFMRGSGVLLAPAQIHSHDVEIELLLAQGDISRHGVRTQEIGVYVEREAFRHQRPRLRSLRLC